MKRFTSRCCRRRHRPAGKLKDGDADGAERLLRDFRPVTAELQQEREELGREIEQAKANAGTPFQEPTIILTPSMVPPRVPAAEPTVLHARAETVGPAAKTPAPPAPPVVPPPVPLPAKPAARQVDPPTPVLQPPSPKPPAPAPPAPPAPPRPVPVVKRASGSGTGKFVALAAAAVVVIGGAAFLVMSGGQTEPEPPATTIATTSITEVTTSVPGPPPPTSIAPGTPVAEIVRAARARWTQGQRPVALALADQALAMDGNDADAGRLVAGWLTMARLEQERARDAASNAGEPARTSQAFATGEARVAEATQLARTRRVESVQKYIDA